MKISTDNGYDNDFVATDDQVTNAVNKFRNHPSIIMIKNKKKNDQSFSFGLITYDDALKKVKTYNTAKASQQSNIPTKILKQNSGYCAGCFYENINQCSRFGRGYNAQLCITNVVNDSAFGALLTDLSKSFDCLPHELSIANLYEYGFERSYLKLIHSYLSNRKQRVKISDGYSL